MNSRPNALTAPSRNTLAATLLALASATAQAQAQLPTYTLIDLSPTAGNAAANALSGDAAAGFTATGIYGTATRATVWNAGIPTDLHPSTLIDPATGNPGRSSILDMHGPLQVGWGSGVITANRSVPLAWRGSPDATILLPIPFTHYGGQAHATDGLQIVGHATDANSEAGGPGLNHALLWDAATGTVIDLGDGGNGAMAYGVGGGQQVGHVVKNQANAALWRGTDKSLVVLHPKNAVTSVANATDGLRQVGYAGYDVRVRAEAAKGNKYARFNYATVWNGTPESASSIHPYPVNSLPGITLSHSFALGMGGGWIVGYAGDATRTGTPAYSHAIVWDTNYQSVDLNAYLPEGFVGAQALAVDANGNVSGFIAKADGTRHAAVWRRNTAE